MYNLSTAREKTSRGRGSCCCSDPDSPDARTPSFSHSAQEIVNAWATRANAAHSDDLTPDFKVVLEQASEYLAVRHDMALRPESYSRRSNDPANDKELQAFLEGDAAKEHAAREVFARECKKLRDGRHALSSQRPVLSLGVPLRALHGQFGQGKIREYLG
jgi:hypothetical protein